MKALSEFVVRVANLAEAEGRLAREKVVEVIMAAGLFLAGALLAVAGLLTFVAALYLGLRSHISPAWAMALVAIIPLAASAACVLFGKHMIKRKP